MTGYRRNFIAGAACSSNRGRTFSKTMGFARAQPILRAANGLNPTQVFTRPGTNVSAIQELIDAGAVEQKILPGINSLGVNSLSAADSAAIGSTFGATGSAIHSLK
jgi:hypothetical protein